MKVMYYGLFFLSKSSIIQELSIIIKYVCDIQHVSPKIHCLIAHLLFKFNKFRLFKSSRRIMKCISFRVYMYTTLQAVTKVHVLILTGDEELHSVSLLSTMKTSIALISLLLFQKFIRNIQVSYLKIILS